VCPHFDRTQVLTARDGAGAERRRTVLVGLAYQARASHGGSCGSQKCNVDDVERLLKVQWLVQGNRNSWVRNGGNVCLGLMTFLTAEQLVGSETAHAK
jgi:hypothetical protein